MANGVSFRRIGGRIVPIHDNQERAKGAAIIAGGAGISFGAGTVAAHLTHESALKDNIARKQAQIATSATKKGYKQFGAQVGKMSRNNATQSKQLLKSAFRVKNLGGIAATSVFAVGVHKILDTTPLKDHPDAETAITAGSTAAAVFGVRSGYLRGVGNRGMKVLKMAAKTALKRIR